MVASAFAAEQKLSLAAPFTDNMILQRHAEVPVSDTGSACLVFRLFGFLKLFPSFHLIH